MGWFLPITSVVDLLRPRTLAGTAACFLLLAPATAALAADRYGEDKPVDLPADQPSRTADAIGGSGGGSLTRTFVGLAVVVAVIYGVAWALRQMKASKEERVAGFGLSSEAVVPLGPNRSVHLIRAGRELVLVGSAEQGVVPIRTYSEDEARRLGLLPPEGGPAPAAPVPRARSLVDELRRRTAR